MKRFTLTEKILTVVLALLLVTIVINLLARLLLGALGRKTRLNL